MLLQFTSMGLISATLKMVMLVSLKLFFCNKPTRPQRLNSTYASVIMRGRYLWSSCTIRILGGNCGRSILLLEWRGARSKLKGIILYLMYSICCYLFSRNKILCRMNKPFNTDQGSRYGDVARRTTDSSSLLMKWHPQASSKLGNLKFAEEKKL